MLDQLTARGTLYQAFDRVRENGGCRGADGMTVGGFAASLEEEIDRLQDRLLRRVYQPFPLLRIGIPKPSSGIRHLSIPTVRDRVVQTAVDLVTRDVFESAFEDCWASRWQMQRPLFFRPPPNKTDSHGVHERRIVGRLAP